MANVKVIKLVGMNETECLDYLNQCMEEFDGVSASFVTLPRELHITLCAEDEDKKQLKSVTKKLKDAYSDYIFTTDSDLELEDVIVNTLTKKELTITTAESCTGGLLAGRIINASGASAVYNQGYITYSNKAKRKEIEVRKETLKKYGAVSKRTAKEMAKGAALVADADVALSVTGIAGPDGGTEEKPVGLVYIGCYYNGKTVVEEHHFKGTRREVRDLTVVCALNLLRKCITI